MPSYLGLKNKFLPNLRQYEATTGRQISDRAQQNFLYSALQTEADRADTNYWRKQQLDLQKQGLQDAADAAKVSGVAQLGQLGVGGYLGYKYMQGKGLLGGGKTVPGDTTTGLLGGGGGGLAANEAVGAQVQSLAAEQGISAQAALESLKATGQVASTATLPATAFAGSAPQVAALDSFYSAGTASTAGAGAASYLLPALPGVIASQTKLSDVEQAGVGGLGGAILGGWAIGGPLGVGIGLGVGVLGSLFDDIF